MVEHIISLLFTAIVVGVLGSGITLLYKVTGAPDFMLTALLPIGAYVGYWFHFVSQSSPLNGIVPAFILGGSVGSILYRVIYAKIRLNKNDPVVLTLASLGGRITLLAFLSIFVYFLRESYFFYSMSFNYFEKGVPNTPTLVYICLGILTFLGLFVFNNSRLGTVWTAVRENHELSQIQGIHIERLNMWTFFIVYGVVSITGLFLPYNQNASPSIWRNYYILSFLGGVIGELNSPIKSFFGGFSLIFVTELIFSYLIGKESIYYGYKWALYPLLIWIIVRKIK